MQKFGWLIVGIIFIVVGILMYFINDNLVKNCTEETIATVVEIEKELSTDSDETDYMYYTVIEYQAGGEKVNVTMNDATSTPQYEIGDKITILYNPNKTSEYIVKGEKTLGILSYVFMGLGVIVTGCGVVMLLKKD